jgi:hypothetical protein
MGCPSKNEIRTIITSAAARIERKVMKALISVSKVPLVPTVKITKIIVSASNPSKPSPKKYTKNSLNLWISMERTAPKEVLATQEGSIETKNTMIPRTKNSVPRPPPMTLTSPEDANTKIRKPTSEETRSGANKSRSSTSTHIYGKILASACLLVLLSLIAGFLSDRLAAILLASTSLGLIITNLLLLTVGYGAPKNS